MDTLKEIEKWAFLKYRLSGRRSMNTYVFTQSKKQELTDNQIELLLNKLEKRIKAEQRKQEKATELQEIILTINGNIEKYSI